MKFYREDYRPTEADLVGEFYYQARLAGFEVYLEAKLPSRHHRSGFMRADAVVVRGEKIICCVEVKRPGKKLPEFRQFKGYMDLERQDGIETVYLNDFSHVDCVIDLIESWWLGSGTTAAEPPRIWKQEPGKPDALQVMVDGA